MALKNFLIVVLIIAMTLMFSAGAAITDTLKQNSQQSRVITYVPRSMTYQGVLKNPAGEPVADSTFDAIFRIFDDESMGNQEWTQTINGIETDDQGRFSATLTNVDLGFDKDYWLEIEVGSVSLSPRYKLNMVPFAGASVVTDYAWDADKLDGLGSEEFAEANHSHLEAAGWVDDGPVIRLENPTDKIGIGTISPQASLHVVSTSVGSFGAIFGQYSGVGNYGYLGGSGYGAFGSGSFAGVYGINPASGNFGYLGSSDYGLYARSDLGTAGYFYGNVDITGDLTIANSAQIGDLIDANRIQLNQFRLLSGANAGYVLTSDASGNGTWQVLNAISGSGTSGSIPKYSGTNTITNSVIYESGNNIGIGITPSSAKLDVSGNVRIRSGLTVDNSVAVADLVDANRIYVTQFRKTGGASSGYVLTSDASGNGTWQPLPSFIYADSLRNLESKLDEVISIVNTQKEKIELLENKINNLENNR